MIRNGVNMIYARSWEEGLRRLRMWEMYRAGQIQVGCCQEQALGKVSRQG